MATLVCISVLFICVIKLSFLFNYLLKKIDELTMEINELAMEIAKIHFSMAKLWLDRSTTIRENNLSDHSPDASKMVN